MSKGSPSAQRLLERGEQELAQAGVDRSRWEAEVLLRQAIGCSRETLLADLAEPVEAEATGYFFQLVDRRRGRVPLQYLLGTQEFIIINHTDCGMLTFKDDELHTKLQQQTRTTAVVPAHFYAFTNLEENVRQQIQKVKSHPWLPNQIPVRGFVYDVKTGRLKEVS